MNKIMIIKRSGEQVPFDKQKIANAVAGANYEVKPDERLSADEIDSIVDAVYVTCIENNGQINVEDIQNYVEDELLDRNTKVAKKFIKYREEHRVARDDSHLKAAIKALLIDSNEEVQTENANKNASLNSTKRDLIAGEACKAIAREEMIPEDVVAAHDKGVIHFHK